MFSYFEEHKPFNFKSRYNDLANQTVRWLDTDSESCYTYNISKKNKKQELDSYGWLDSNVEYSFNSHGFRCNEFTGNPSIMFVGCSITIGIGLPCNLTWAAIVSNYLNLECANLGQGAGAPDTAFRMCLGYIDIVKPKILVYLDPPPIRMELVDNNFIHTLGHWAYKDHRTIYNYWTFDFNNHYFNVQKNILAMNMLCTQRNIKFLFVPSSIHDDPIDFARDLGHPGKLANKKIADYVIDNLSKENGT